MTDITTLSADVSKASALVTLFGVYLLSWRPVGHPDVLWLSPHVALSGTETVRGDVLLCLSWFSSPTDSPMGPSRGAGVRRLAHTSPQTLLGSAQPVNDVSASFSFELHRTGEASILYPHSFCARLDVTIGAGLNTTLILTSEDGHPFVIETALRTYLHVSDVKDVTVEDLGREYYYDRVYERYTTQTDDVTFIGPAGRIYTSAQLVQAVDPKLGRHIAVDESGSGSMVIRSPWSQGTVTMSDIGEGGWQNFVCVGTAAVRKRALILWPGHLHTVTQTLAAEALN